MKELLERIRKLNDGIPPGQPVVPAPELIALNVIMERKLCQMKVSTLAAMAGVSVSTVERIERGDAVSREVLDKVGRVFGKEDGYYTAPRIRKTPEETIAELNQKYANLEAVEVRELKTQPQVRDLGMCCGCLVYCDEITEEANCRKPLGMARSRILRRVRHERSGGGPARTLRQCVEGRGELEKERLRRAGGQDAGAPAGVPRLERRGRLHQEQEDRPRRFQVQAHFRGSPPGQPRSRDRAL